MQKFEGGSTLMGVLLGIIVALLIAIGAALTWGSAPIFDIFGPNRDDAAIKNMTKIEIVLPLPSIEPKTINAEPLEPGPLESVPEIAPDNGSSFVAELEEEATTDSETSDQVEAAQSPVRQDEEAEIIAPPIYEYQIQAGSFGEQLQAEAELARLTLAGLEPRIVDLSTSNSSSYKVRLGPFHDKATLQAVLAKLSENEIDGTVTRSIKLMSKPRTDQAD